ncbi:MAG: Uma2 family endonuclease [Deltaproteobacteria bacterium]|nr:Uma2 family endonuclease [Deltaproteobacteria bacterium]
MVASPLAAAYRLTYADWLGFPDDGRSYELIQGELIVTPSPSIGHQRVSREIEFRLLQHLRASGTGEVLDAPVGVRLSETDVLEPDLLVVLRQNAHRIGEQVVEGAPDLVVEILSPGSAVRDLGVKRRTYEGAGVAEYWIVDPVNRSIDVLALQSGSYVRHGLFGVADLLTSRVLPEFSLPVGEVFPVV